MKRYLTLALVSLTLSLALATQTPTNAQTNAQTDRDAQRAAKIKSEVNSHGVGATVNVKLRNKNKLTGDIKHVGEQDFTLTLADSSASQTIAYTDALQVKRQRQQGMSTRAKVGFIVVGTLIVLSLIGNGFGG